MELSATCSPTFCRNLTQAPLDEPINRGREVELSKELALEVIGYGADGQPDAADNLVKKLYLAAMAQPGAFVEPKLPE